VYLKAAQKAKRNAGKPVAAGLDRVSVSVSLQFIDI
jgi:hypothetical protein